ncbi:phosphoglycerate dehydrogenase [Streptomyces sp. NL15-2K]|uniref:phosphoglycerate dehydrogenase n=1 Tax=Streptomyces sp. NL15-2K TaxID=376149 RepID=UPI000F58F088|nr:MULTISPECIES: phosphoglycerate dehydrogenase [Actinomycetes]WKX12814.1 phosphoglycerate dehydrogenase [Kutzneria buriramensis]GCB45880.1 D-3-phosphoglycerate dehydrogenase [Streptomyces sp. NL15-2K]
MDKPVVLIAEELSPATVDALGPDFEIRHCAGADRGALLDALPAADAVLVRSATRMDAEAIATGTRLKVIGRAGVGLDNVDVPAASRAGVMVVNAPTSNIVSAAEHTVGLLLAVARNIPQADAALREGRWQRSRFTGVELADKTLGIVGLGRIGSLVARRMAAFGMTLLAYDPYVPAGYAERTGVRAVALDTLLDEADFLTVHLPRTPETTGLIGFDALHRVKPDVRIVNASRGGIVDEAELYAALKEGRIAGAAMDVFATEPCTSSPLYELDNVVVTPHLGAGTAEAQERAGVSVARSVREALSGRFVPEAVNVRMGEVDAALDPWLTLAERLGRLFTATAGGLPGQLRVTVSGEIARHDVAALELAGLKGVLGQVVEGGVSYVNAPLIAQERGLGTEVRSGPDSPVHRSLVRVDGTLPSGEPVSVTGTLTGLHSGARLVEICGYEVDVALDGDLAFFLAPDRPGVIGAVSEALGQAGVPVESLRIARGAGADGTALVALGLGGPAAQAVLDDASAAIEATRGWSLEQTG